MVVFLLELFLLLGVEFDVDFLLDSVVSVLVSVVSVLVSVVSVLVVLVSSSDP